MPFFDDQNAIGNLANRFTKTSLDRANISYPSENGTSSTKTGIVVSKKLEQSHQFSYLFFVELPDLSLNQTESYGYSNPSLPLSVDNEEIAHRVYSINGSMTGFDTKKNTDGSTFMYTAAHSDIEPLTMTIDEMEDGGTLSYIMNWMSMIQNDDGSFNMPNQYKRNIIIVTLTANHTKSHVSEYMGFFPTSIDPIQFNNEDNGVLQYQVTFTGDTVKHTRIPPKQVKNFVPQSDQGILLDTVREKVLPKITNTVANKIINKYKQGDFFG